MKKLLTTMSAVAVAMSLYATDSGALSGTSFEGLGAGPYSITAKGDAEGGELGTFTDGTTTYWVTNSTATLEIVAQRSSAATRPEAFDSYSQDRYLSIKTTLGNPVSRRVTATGLAESIGAGLYFDSLVKFTAFDGDQTVDLGNDGKLAIWLKENEDGPSTNLIITAGYIDSNGDATVTNYTCTVVDHPNLLDDGGWHRVTVRMINSIFTSGTTPGFLIAIDENKVVSGATKFVVPAGNSLTREADAFNAEGSLFPSALQTGSKTSITAVSFDGQGCVDDLVFTRTQPDCVKDPDFFTITISNDVASAKYALNGSETPVTITNTTGSGTVSVTVPFASGTYFTISDVIPAPGYMKDEPYDLVGGMTFDGSVYGPVANSELVIKAKPLGAYVNGRSFSTLAEAIAYVNDPTQCASGTYTITLAANASGNVNLTNAGITNILDLAGNTFTGTSIEDAAITVSNDVALTIKDTIGGGIVQGAVDNDGALVGAVDCGSGTIAIEGGTYRGTVNATAKSISGGYFLMTHQYEEEGVPVVQPVNEKETLDTMIIDGYEATNNGSTLYWAVTEKAATTVTVTVNGGANATAAWTTNGVAAAEAPATLTQGDTWAVTYTANAGYFFEAGAITSTNGVAGTENITITISDAVQAVAQIEGGAQYATLKGAIDAASAGATVTVLANCEVTAPITFTKGITVSNDYVVTAANAGNSITYAYRVINGTSTPVTLCGTGTFTESGTPNGSQFLVGFTKTRYDTAATAGSLVLDGCTVTNGQSNVIKVENGTFTMNSGTIDAAALRGVKADGEDGANSATLTINGGTINSSTKAVAVSSKAGGGAARATINGGYITGSVIDEADAVDLSSITIPGNSTARFDRDQTALCAPGYCTTLNDGWYTVGLATYTITYKDNEGNLFTAEDWAEGYTAPTTFTVTAPATLPVAANIARDGVTFNGWTNSVGTTIAATTAGIYENLEVFADFTPVVAPTYPSYINTSDATITGQYDAWALANNVPAGANDYEAYFLLNVAPNLLGATLSATAVSISGTTVTIDINHAVNGYPYIKKAATVAGLASATPIAIEITPADKVQGLDNGARITLTGESGTAQFYQIGVQSAPVAVPNAD